MTTWPSTDQVGKRAVVPGQRVAGLIIRSRLTQTGRMFTIETPTGNEVECAEGECHPEGAPPPASIPFPVRNANPMQVTYMSTTELAALIVLDGRYAETVAPRAVQILAEDYLALRALLAGGA